MNEPHDPRLSDLYRRSAPEEPMDETDRIILQVAQRAISTTRRFEFRGWALAATLVLGFGIGWQLLVTTPEDTPIQPQPAAESLAPPKGLVGSVERAKAGIAAGSSSPLRRRESDADREGAPARPVEQYSAPMAADRGQDEQAAVESASTACSALWLADDQAPEVWLAAIASARAAGEAHRAACLETRYRQFFVEKHP